MAQGTTITLLHVNDTHSHLDAVGPKNADLSGTLGGIAKAASVIGMIKQTESNVLLLHAGDVFQGDFFFNKYFGVPEFQIMKQLGFDAMAVGNHEFDFGPGVLNDVLSTAFVDGSFPLVSANLELTGFSQLQLWIQPSITREIDGIKIGIFGMTVPGDPTNMPAPVVIREDIAEIAYAQVQQLRGAGAEVVICLSHLGVYLDKIIAANIPGIDFIVGGHDHFVFAQPIAVANPVGGQTLIFQAGDHYKNVGRLTFTVTGGSTVVNGYEIISVDASIPPVSELQGVVDFLKQGIVEQYGDVYGSVVGTATVDIEKRFNAARPWRDVPLGNLVTDAFRAKAGTEIAVTPIGLISEKLYAGPIVGADVFRALSYGFDEETGLGFKLAKGRILGQQLLKGLEIGLSNIEVTEDFILQVSGLEYSFSPKRPVGHRVTVGSVRIGGKPFVPVQTYSITVNTGILYLLGTFGITLSDVEVLPDFEYHVVRDYIAQLGTVSSTAEGRIRDMSVVFHAQGNANKGESAPPVQQGLRLGDNYPNPFNPSTSIVFELTEPGFVALKVYNMLGQEVALLANENLPAGKHMRTFNAAKLASGVYIYRLTAGNIVQTKRMILMK